MPSNTASPVDGLSVCRYFKVKLIRAVPSFIYATFVDKGLTAVTNCT